MPLAPPGRINAPEFPVFLKWVNVPRVRMDRMRDRPVLVEFWDFCRPNSMRTLPYMKAWHERYADAGLTLVGVHSPGFPPSEDLDAVRAAVARLGIEYAVIADPKLEVWTEYGNEGWPARYLWGPGGSLFSYHYGEGAYAETELQIAQLLGLQDVEPVPPVRPEDAEGAVLVPQTADVEGAFSGGYAAGGVWGVFSGTGEVVVNGRALRIDATGAQPLIEHERHTEGELALEVGPGVRCWATCFVPGVAGD